MKHILLIFSILILSLGISPAQNIVPEPLSVITAEGTCKRGHKPITRIDTVEFRHPEAYKLTVTPREIRITGGSAAGVFTASRPSDNSSTKTATFPASQSKTNPVFPTAG